VTKPAWILLIACVGFLSGCSRQQPAGYRIYVTNEASGDLSVIDSAAHEVVATVKLGKRPRGIQASPDGSTIYVALSGSPFAPPGIDESTLPPPDRRADGIGVFDVRQNKLLRILESGPDPEQFDVTRDGNFLYVSNEDSSAASLIDLKAGTVKTSIPVGEEPEGVTLSPDGKFVYVTSEDDGAVFVIDTASNKVVKNLKVGLRPRSVAFLRDGSRAYVTLENDGAVAVVNAATHELLRTIALGDRTIKPMGLVLSPDGTKLYVSAGRSHKVFVIETAGDRVIESFEAGERPWGIAVSPDGKTLYTANGPSNDVSVINLATRTVTRKVKVSDRPWGVLILDKQRP